MTCCWVACRAVLPLPGAFASTGIVCATVLIVAVGLANVYTNDILLWQAHSVRRHDYETLSFAIAGPIYKVHPIVAPDSFLRMNEEFELSSLLTSI